MDESSTSLGVDGESKAMLDIATPDLYRVNAFRVLGLPVDVSNRELSRQQKKMKMLEKLGEDAAHAQFAILPLNPPPDGDAIRRSGQQLRDPELRLVHELFWFWPAERGDSDSDGAISLLRQRDLTGAHHTWTQFVEHDGEHRSVSAHNLAVLHHAIALDMERSANLDGGQPGAKFSSHRDKHWQHALKYWSAVAIDDAIWDRLTARIREMDDPRLTAGLARRLRRTLPAALLTISIGLAVRSAKRGDTGDAHRHIVYVRNSGLDARLAAALLDREAAPLVERIKQICEPVPERSKADPEHADELVKRVWTEIKPLLTIISALLDNRHPLREAALDVAAGTVRNCAIDYGKATENWERCAALLKQAVKIAADEGMHARLHEDIAQVESILLQDREYKILKDAVTGNQVYDVTLAKDRAYKGPAGGLVPGLGGGLRATVPGVCACCLGKPDGEHSVSYEWEERQGQTRYKRSMSFAFPICRQCREHQAEYSLRRWGLAILAAGGSTAMAYLVASQMSDIAWFPFVLLGSPLTGVALLVCSLFVRLSILDDKHSCRDAAVEMSDASGNSVTFCFHNPLYADAFAKANDASVTSHSYTKPPRGTYLLRGRAAVFAVIASLVLGAIGHTIVYASMDGRWKRESSAIRQDDSPQTSADRSVALPSNSYSPPRTSHSTYSYTGLSDRIKSAKARVESLESQVKQMDSNLESLSSQIGRYKQTVEDYERRARLDRDVSKSLYQQALDGHNALVDRYNSSLAERNAKVTEYRREVDSLNDMVRRYNSGER